MAKKEQETVPEEINEVESTAAEAQEGAAKEAEDSTEGIGGGERFEDLNALIQELDRVSKAHEDEQQKSAEMQARYLRSVADLENFRKRALKEKEELNKMVTAGFAEDLLPVLDNFKLGMKSAESHPEAKVVVDGFKMVLDQLFEVFKSKGIEEIVPNGQEFDPQFEEGVSHIPHPEIPENHVIETIRPGYKIKERLIRAATVVVSSGPQK